MDTLSVKLGTYHFVLDLANTFFSTVKINLPLPWKGRQWTFTVLPMVYLHSPTIYNGFMAEYLTGWAKPSTIQLYQHIDDIMLTSDVFRLRAGCPSLGDTPAGKGMGHQ